MISHENRAVAEEKETGRIEAFSDGTRAVAITLLALDLKVPPASNDAGAWAFLHGLARQWPSYVALVTSFITVLIMWVNHHDVFRVIRKTSTRLLFANGLLLLLMTAVPFSTVLFSEYFDKPGARAAAGVYGGTSILTAVAYGVLWLSILGDRSLLRRDASEKVISGITRSYRRADLSGGFAGSICKCISYAGNLHEVLDFLVADGVRRVTAIRRMLWMGIARAG